MAKVIGVDLGTTNSVVAVVQAGVPVVIPNAEGFRTTPSIVAFSPKTKEKYVGPIAKRQAIMNPENTFYSVKRFIGTKANEILEESKQVPYEVTSDNNKNVRVYSPALDKQFSPEEISAQILMKLSKDATNFLNEQVSKAVITVPAYFNDSQRQATKDAGKIAGLEVLRIINEPTAAALAYGLDKKSHETILIFDLGGGTFDVSILEVGDGVFEVLSTSGDSHLGGDDFDNILSNYIRKEFEAAKGVSLKDDKQALQRIREAAEDAKIKLSQVTEVDVVLPYICLSADGSTPEHIELTLTRGKFEELCSHLIQKCLYPVETALSDAKIKIEKLDEVILVGGSSRIPAVQELVYKLTNKKPNLTVNPDEVVALGAAINGAVLAGEIKDILLLDVTPLSLGVETMGGLMTRMIQRNTTVPITKSETFSTADDNQKKVDIHILQGERTLAVDNKSLGNFQLENIPPAPRGIPQIEVTFDIDTDGILAVSARDKVSGQTQSITIKNTSTLDAAEIEKFVQEAAKNAAIDEERKKKIELKNKAEMVTGQVERALRDSKEQISLENQEILKNILAELQEMKNNENYSNLDTCMKKLEDVLAKVAAAQKSQSL